MLVTIGLPFFNAERTLESAVRSVFAQTWNDWELLLLDDGSKDRSVEMARSIRDSRVRVISDGVNRGVVYRHNQMAQLAQGEYIAKLDDDDVMHPDRLQKQIAFMQAASGVDVVTTSVYTITDNSVVSGLRSLTSDDLTHANVIRRCVMVQPATMGKREWFRRNPYDPLFLRAEDHELWVRTFPHSTFAVLPEPLTYYREGRSRTLRKYFLSMRSDRVIYRKYATSALSWQIATQLVAMTYVKAGGFCALRLSGLENIAFQNSKSVLPPEAQMTAQATLDRTVRTSVPGWAPLNGAPMSAECALPH